MVSLSLAQKNVTRKQERSLLTIVGVILAVASFVALLSIAEGLYQRLHNEVYSRNIDIYILPSSSIPLPTGPIGAIGFISENIYINHTIHGIVAGNPAEGGKEGQSSAKPPQTFVGNIIDYLRLPDAPLADDESPTTPYAREAYKKFPEGTRSIDNIRNAIGVSRFQYIDKGMTVIIWGIPFEPAGYTEKDFLTAFFPNFQVIDGVLPIPPADREIADPYCTGGGMTFSDLAGSQDKKNENLVLIAGEKIARELNLKVGDTYEIKRSSGTVKLKTTCIGRFNTGFQDYFCFIPVQTSLLVRDTPGRVDEIWVQVRDKSLIKKTKEDLKQAFPDLAVKTSEEYLGASSDLVKYAWILQFTIALIGILIATTASMNTMLMSTFERIKEFGALRAIGTPRLTIISMIFIESLILSITGGVVGIVVGLLGSKLLDTAVMSLFQISFPLARITAPLVLYAFSLSLFIGFIGALIPAIIIYRMDVIQALRWE